MRATHLAGSAAVLGTLGVALAWILIARERFWANWVLWQVLLVTVALGALFLVALEHLVGARWSVPIRRVPERVAGLLWLAAPATLVALFSLPVLFHRWSGAEAAQDPVVSGKAAWLNIPFFSVRVLLCLAAWLVSYAVLVRGSLRQDATRDARFNLRARRFAPAFMVAFAITVTLVAFDWIASIEPAWYSDVFGVYLFAGSFLAGLAATTLAVLRQKGVGRLARITGGHVYNLGALMFAFTVFWGYIGFAQFMLMWYADLPEEVFWYRERTLGSWLGVVLVLVVARFFVPFFALITADAKSDPVRLRWVAVLMLFGHWVDLYWLVFPSLGGAVAVSWPEIAFALLFGGAAVVWLRRALDRGEAMPVGDPFLPEALEIGR
jgi:hypothetical protein